MSSSTCKAHDTRAEQNQEETTTAKATEENLMNIEDNHHHTGEFLITARTRKIKNGFEYRVTLFEHTFRPQANGQYGTNTLIISVGGYKTRARAMNAGRRQVRALKSGENKWEALNQLKAKPWIA